MNSIALTLNPTNREYKHISLPNRIFLYYHNTCTFFKIVYEKCDRETTPSCQDEPRAGYKKSFYPNKVN